MSRAFLKEDAPQPEAEERRRYQVLWTADPARRDWEIVNSGDDLLDLVHWAETRDRGFLELRDDEGELLARVGPG